MRLPVLAALAAALVLAAPASAEPVVQTADGPNIHAEFSFDRTVGEGDNITYSNLLLKTTEDGEQAITDRIEEGFIPGGFEDKPSVAVADLDRDGRDEVLLDLYSGGAHCCFVSRVYDGQQTIERDFRDAGYELVQRGGRTWFKTADISFVSAYGSFASSILPLQVLDYTGTHGFEDVTKAVAWRRDVKAEAAQILGDYLRARKHPGRLGRQQTLRAALAAYAADQCSLGKCSVGFRRIRDAIRRGEIRRFGSPGKDPGQVFLKDVRRRLKRGGYLG